MRRLAGTVGAVALCAGLAAAPAGADTTGSATAKAAYGSAVTIAPGSPTSSGLLGTTVSGLLQPLTDTLSQTVNGTTSGLVTALLNASGDNADTSGGATSYPRGATLGVTVPGLATLSLGSPSGSVTSSPTYSATSSFSNSTLSLLGSPVANLGVSSATASCPNSGSPSSTVSLAGVSLFNGAVQTKLAQGSSVLQVSLNNGSYVALSSLSSTLTAVPGTPVSVRANGNLLQVTQSISLDTLLGGLGLTSLLSSVSGLTDTSATSLKLSVTVGPGASSTGAGATAWGLEVGADLAGTVSVSLLSALGGLAGTSTVTIPSGISGTSYGNLLDLKLGYAACIKGSGSTNTTVWVPPGLI